MKWLASVALTMMSQQLVDVVSVRVLVGHTVELTFDDGAVKVLDLEGWLTGPDFAWLRGDYAAFSAVTVEPASGTIQFQNGAQFSPAALYEAARPVPARLLRAPEVARRLGVTTRAVLRLMLDRQIESVMVEGIAHVPETAVPTEDD